LTARRHAGNRGWSLSWSVAVLAVVVAAVGLLTVSIRPAGAAPTAARVQFHLSDHRIDEASGIGVGLRSPEVVYVQNDSGDSARFFALDRRTGRTLAVFTVPGAVNVDWEDLAVARDSRGVPSIWLADTGDNDARRKEVRIYRVDEPVVTDGLGSVTQRTARPDVWRLRYPSGPVNVEALAVAPGGAMALATKSPLGDTVVYSVPARPDARTVQTVRRIGAFRVPTSDGPLGGGSLFGLLVTGAAISPGGDRLVLRTYTNAYVWALRSGDVAAALRTAPVRIALPVQPQGEGVTFDGNALLIDSEGIGSAVWSVPLPARSSTAAAATPSKIATSSAGLSPRAAAAVPAPASAVRSGSSRATEVIGLCAAVALVGGGAIFLRSRRGERG
jgi:hypothetical protein